MVDAIKSKMGEAKTVTIGAYTWHKPKYESLWRTTQFWNQASDADKAAASLRRHYGYVNPMSIGTSSNAYGYCLVTNGQYINKMNVAANYWTKG